MNLNQPIKKNETICLLNLPSMKNPIYYIAILLLNVACQGATLKPNGANDSICASDSKNHVISANEMKEKISNKNMTEIMENDTLKTQFTDDQNMEAMGLVDVTTLVPDVEVSLQYATSDNFTGVKLYETLTKAYLHPLAAKSLSQAQETLSALRPGCRIKIYDASRPMSAQKRMYRVVQGTPMAPYVGNPNRGGGLHNYGMAVDVTIIDENGRELDMGTKFDHFGKEANIDKEELLVSKRKLTPVQVSNRQLLRKVMTSGGFTPLQSEWWHFNRCTGDYARSHYPLIDF